MSLRSIFLRNAWTDTIADNKDLMKKNNIKMTVAFSQFLGARRLTVKDKLTQELIYEFLVEQKIKEYDEELTPKQIALFMSYKNLECKTENITEELIEEYKIIDPILKHIGRSKILSFYKFLSDEQIKITKNTDSSILLNEFLSYSTKNMNDTKYLYNHAEDVIKMNMDFVSKARLEGFKVEVNMGGERESHLKKIGAYGQLAGYSGANFGAMMEPNLKTMKVNCRIAPKGIRLTPWKSNELFDLRIPWETIRQVSTSSKGLLIKSDETTVSFIMENQNEIKTFWALIIDNTNLTVEDDGW